jgi:NAD+ kinase
LGDVHLVYFDIIMRMADFVPIPRRIGIIFHPHLPEAANEARLIAEYLKERGLPPQEITTLDDGTFRQRLRPGSLDLMIVDGGDGTVLRAGRTCAPFNIPIFGINAGRIGFLSEVSRERWRERIPRLLEGEYRLEKRMMLRCEHWRGDTMLEAWDVLNEVVVCRGQYVRPILIKALVDGYEMAAYMADGVIAATPTGSTAYALAVGGPILPPELRNILVIPVAPHLSMDRAIVLSEGVNVTINAFSSHEAVLSADGQESVPVLDGDSIRTCAGEHDVAFVRFQDASYFYRNLNRYMERNSSVNGVE